LLAGVVTIGLSLAGCKPAPPTVRHVEPDPRPAAPDLSRIKVDPANRVVRLYELQPGGQWWVVLPGDPSGHPIPREYHLADGVEWESVEVYYTAAGYGLGRPSASVRLSAAVREP
jgi:hypothetical protein